MASFSLLVIQQFLLIDLYLRPDEHPQDVNKRPLYLSLAFVQSKKIGFRQYNKISNQRG